MQENVLFDRITLVTPGTDGQVTVRQEAWIAVKDGRIACVAPDRTSAEGALEGTDYVLYPGRDRLLLPTFANTHNHMAMSLLRNAADDLALHNWLFDVIFPREEKLDYGLVATGSRLALAEMIRSGTGASADMYFYHEAAIEAALEAGFRLNFSVDAKRPDSSGAGVPDERILSEQIRRWRSEPLLRVSLLVHSVYLYPQAVYPQLAAMAAGQGCTVQIHVAETAREVRECLQQYGRRPAAQLARFGFFQTPTLAAHCVPLDDEERASLARPAVYVAHCPASNLKLGSGMADIVALQEAGATVVLGTDGPASNNNLDMYHDMRLASLLGKGLRRDAALLPAATMLKMATQDGCAALGYADSGLIAAGWQADLQVVRTDSPGFNPPANPVNALLYSAAAADVESLMVAGQWLMYKRALQTLDEEKTRFEAEQAAARLAP